jgi:uncharacterized membrane protein
MSRSHTLPAARWLATAALALSAAQAQATSYQFTTLVAPDGSPAQVFDINNHGQIALTATSGPARGYVYSGGGYTALAGPDGALGFNALGLSDNDVVVGSFYSTLVIDPETGETYSGPESGYIFDGSTYTTFNVPGADGTQPRGVSPDGRYVTGFYGVAGGNRAFLLDRSNGSFTDLSTPDSLLTIAQGVNASGTVVGSDLISAGGGTTRPGFTYDIGSGVRSDTLLPGYTRTAFRDIDSRGLMVGWVLSPDSSGASTFTGIVGAGLVFDTLTVPGAESTYLEGLNDAGWLTGNYSVGEIFHGFVAVPVPEPHTWALLLAGLGCLALRPG